MAKKKTVQEEIELYEVGDILVSCPTKNSDGDGFLAGIPVRTGDKATIGDGVLLKVVGFKALNHNLEPFYVIEIMTGPNASDQIYIAPTLTRYMDLVPSRKR